MLKQALDGVKVCDFSWVAMGPVTSRYLADHGATVIKVESNTKVDLLRSSPPFKGSAPGLNRSSYFAAYNTNKFGVSLRLNHTKGLEVAHRLVKWADIVLENFSPGSIERLGLGYEDLKKIKPDIIMMSLSIQGRGGPYSRRPGLGNQVTGLTGHSFLTGWSDKAPVKPYAAYTDFITPRFAASLLIAALEYRGRTGKGIYFDMSQYETAIHFLSPIFLDYFVNGRIAQREGNRSPCASPHGVYPCKGAERWCAIAVFSDEEWHNLVKAMGNPEWSYKQRFATLESRKKNEDELDELIAAWTIKFPAEEIMARLQNEGVASGIVKNCQDLSNDPQLKHRNHYWELSHPELGSYVSDSQSFRLSETPCRALKSAPCLGQDNDYVYTQLLGMSDDEFVELLQMGVFD